MSLLLDYCCDPDGVHDAETMRIDDALSFGRSRIEPLPLMPLGLSVPCPVVPVRPGDPAEPDDPAVLPVPEVAPLVEVAPEAGVLPAPESVVPLVAVPRPPSRRPWIST